MTESTAPADGDPSEPVAVEEAYSKSYLVYVLGLAFTINIFNIADRMILGIVLEPLKAEFGLSDLQLGLLSGMAFTLVYTTLGIPLGAMADRRSRRHLITACVGIWSAMTVACGSAKSFFHLVVARAGVALGESGFTPAIHSLLSDYFPPGRRATVLAIYGLGTSVGTFFGNAVGGYFAQTFGWRAAFVAVGAPGLILAVLVLLTVREPRRGRTEARRDDQPAPPLRAAISFAWNTRSVRYLMFGAGAHLFVFYGLGIWLAPFYIRTHELTVGQVGLWLGLITGVFGGAGTLLGGLAADRLGRRNPGWYGWLPAASLALMLPFGVALYLAPTAGLSLGVATVVAALGGMWLAPTFATVQHVSPLRMRGVVAGVLIFTQNMIGMGLGPLAVGWLSDGLKPEFGSESLRWALLSVFFVEIFAVLLYFRAGKFVAADMRRSAKNELPKLG